MTRIRFLSIAAASGFLFLGSSVQAEETSYEQETAYAEETYAEETYTEAAPADAGSAYPAFEIGGWVDTSMYYDNLDDGQNNKLGFEFAQVGIRMSHAINENYGGFVQLNAFGPEASLDLVAREAYGYYQTDEGGFKLLAGKFYAPIGFELADPPDLYQFTNSLVFDNLIPTELVGALAALQITDNIDLQLYVSGPWDNDLAALEMGGKNLGTRLGIGFGDLGGIGLSAVGGPQDPSDEGLLRIAYDLDLALTPTDELLIGAEVNMNQIHQRVGADEKEFLSPYGFLVMANYVFTDLFNLTLRYDMVFDDEGVIFMAGDDITRSSITVAPNFALAPGWDVFTEVRYDMANDDIFSVGGEAASGFLSAAVELIYQF